MNLGEHNLVHNTSSGVGDICLWLLLVICIESSADTNFTLFLSRRVPSFIFSDRTVHIKDICPVLFHNFLHFLNPTSRICAPFHKSHLVLFLLRSPPISPLLAPLLFLKPCFSLPTTEPALLPVLDHAQVSQSPPPSLAILLVMDFTHFNFQPLVIRTTFFFPLWLHGIEANTAELFYHWSWVLLSLSLSLMVLCFSLSRAIRWELEQCTFFPWVFLSMFLLFFSPSFLS